jgi:hypothetical protein
MDYPTSQVLIPIVTGLVEPFLFSSHIKRQIPLIVMILQMSPSPIERLSKQLYAPFSKPYLIA